MSSSQETINATSSLNYEEEIFCLNFKLKAMSNVILRNEGERWVHGFMYGITEDEHLSRYNYLLKRVGGKNVLDIACGSGYGSYLLATHGGAAHVDGVDLNEQAIRYGSHRYAHPAIRRWVGDAEKYVAEGAYDAIVTFETVEHLPNYNQFLKNVERSLAPGGMLYISTPITRATTKQCANPYHVIEWSFSDFQQLISERFNIQEVFVQNIHLVGDIQNPSLLSRISQKLFPPPPQQKRPMFESYNGQYPASEIYHGYQILVCKRKA